MARIVSTRGLPPEMRTSDLYGWHGWSYHQAVLEEQDAENDVVDVGSRSRMLRELNQCSTSEDRNRVLSRERMRRMRQRNKEQSGK